MKFNTKVAWTVNIMIIVVMGYFLYNQISGQNIKRAEEEKWTNNDYQVLVNKCIQ